MRIKIKAPKTEPAFATKEQYQEARKLLGISLNNIAESTNAFSLPVDKNSVVLIEAGEPPHPPSHSTGANLIDYRGKDSFYGTLDYRTRLHIYYQLRGIVFFPDGKVCLTEPIDLWGHLARLDEAFVPDYDDPNLARIYNDKPLDVLRHLLKRFLPKIST